MLNLKTLNPQYVTDEEAEQTSIILPIGKFRDIIEDLAAIAERREEPAIPHAEFISQLKRDGFLPN